MKMITTKQQEAVINALKDLYNAALDLEVKRSHHEARVRIIRDLIGIAKIVNGEKGVSNLQQAATDRIIDEKEKAGQYLS